MLVKATTAFTGRVSMAKGKVRDIPEGELLNDLLKAGYVKPEGGEQIAQAEAQNEGGEQLSENGAEDAPAEITEVKPVEAKRGKAK